MSIKTQNKNITLSTIVLFGLLAYFLTPISSEIQWLECLLYIISFGFLFVGVTLLIIWLRKKKLEPIESVLKDIRGNIFFDMVLMVGVVTNYVTGRERMALLWLIMAIVDVLATFIPFSTEPGDHGKNIK